MVSSLNDSVLASMRENACSSSSEVKYKRANLTFNLLE